ncbi:LacI family DNA-binding transcriptional regulator [Microbacterium betulae]|uniref:LacI family DNA-binding transcriptional regulator n=1 Tax=Microbacterium betulae TaxID=2981139 RepID=A0AA97FK64_9MICO|nr:LacI family DNA-binding transcriptional regulator [Microbacterium sp. AB]WOF24288.1 LacI family DNA-binding transcriptional regulator [Microbacterium sp. AB]
MTDTPARIGTAPTLHDVAREAGVSLATASRVLNGSTRKVAEAYRERVQTAADRLGYTANVSAQAIARGTSATVALIVADIADPYFGQIASGVAHAAEEAGLIVTVAMTERDPRREVALVRALRGQRPRGIVLAASRDASGDADALTAEIAAVQSTGGRVVTLGSALPGTRVIAYGNEAGAHELGERLAGLGYRSSVVLAGPEGLRTSDDRLAGFTAGFAAGGGSAPRVERGQISRDDGFASMTRLLQEGVDPGTLVFGISDVVAIGALSALRDAGRQPGRDIAVAGFDDIATGRDITPGLTTVRLPLEELGAQALHAAVDPDWTAPAPVDLDVLIRESTPGL